MTQSAFAGIERAIADVATGCPVIVMDDEDRENEGDLIFAAAWATPELLAFTIRYTSRYVCVALPGEDYVRLDLPPMFHTNIGRLRPPRSCRALTGPGGWGAGTRQRRLRGVPA